MITIDYSYSGGFPFEQPVFDKMQNAYLDILASLVGFLRIPNSGNHILFGCQVAGADITSGMMFIDGDLCSFAGAPGTAATKIKKSVVVSNAAFFGGVNNPVYRQTTAIVDGAGAELSAFTRYTDQLVYDGNYVHTDNNFTAALLAKLNSIAAGAEVNVQADWNVANPLSDAFIKNKPTILNVLKKEAFVVGDVSNNSYTVPFGETLPTADYSVFVTFESPAGNAGQSATYIYVIHSKTTTSFSIHLNETNNHAQVLTMNYLIIAN